MFQRRLNRLLQSCTSFKGRLIVFRLGSLLGGNVLNSFADFFFYGIHLFTALFVFCQLAEGLFNLPLFVPVRTGLGKFSF